LNDFGCALLLLLIDVSKVYFFGYFFLVGKCFLRFHLNILLVSIVRITNIAICTFLSFVPIELLFFFTCVSTHVCTLLTLRKFIALERWLVWYISPEIC